MATHELLSIFLSQVRTRENIAINLLLPIAILSGFSLCIILIKRVFFSPLRKIPGPFIAAVTGIWIWRLDLKGKSVATTYDLHQKHGKAAAEPRPFPCPADPSKGKLFESALRKSASKILRCTRMSSTNWALCFKRQVFIPVQGLPLTKVCQSPEYYNAFAVAGHNVFTVSDPTEHAYFRRQLSSQFARKTLLSFETQLWEHAYVLLKQLSLQATNGMVVDLVKMGRCLAMDVISKYQYGDSSNALLKPAFHEELLDVIEGFAPINHFVGSPSSLPSSSNVYRLTVVSF